MIPRQNLKLTPRQIKTLRAMVSHWRDHVLNGEDPLDRASLPESERDNHGRNPYLNLSEVETLENTLIVMETGKGRARMSKM